MLRSMVSFRIFQSWILKTLAIMVLTMLVSACNSTVLLRSPLNQPPLVEKSQIPVAIVYSERLLHHKCIIDKGYIAETWTLALGPPSIEMFNLIFDALFDQVLVASIDSDTLASIGPRNVIEVSLLMFNGCEASWPIVGASIEVAYEAILRNADGATIARWEGRGQAGPDDDLERYAGVVPALEVETDYLSAVTGIAMRKAAADFIINFDRDAGIRAWLGK